MSVKYLPIGTICTLKGKHRKVMITGFYSVEFNGNLKINDYSGCSYPEGLLFSGSVCTFNHSDIENIDFMGYESEAQIKFNSLLKRLTENEVEQKKSDNWVLASSKSYSKLLFDENGVVVLAEPVKSQNEVKLAEEKVVDISNNSKVENPFYTDYSSISKKNEVNLDEKIFGKYKFDENGILISIENSEYEEKEIDKICQQNSNFANNIKFNDKYENLEI